MIYLVEDDDSIRELVLYTLHTTGFEAEGFRNAADFWQALEKELPQLVLRGCGNGRPARDDADGEKQRI